MDAKKTNEILQTLGIETVNPGATTGGTDGWLTTSGQELVSYSPIDGQPIARVAMAEANDYDTLMAKAVAAFASFKMMPAPKRGRWSGRSGTGSGKKRGPGHPDRP